MKKSIILAAAMAISCTMFAQKDSLNAVINVENDYAPVVTKATKKGFTPQTEQNTGNTPLELEFSQKANPFKGFTSERDVTELLPGQKKSLPGYARLGYGTGNNVDGKISYQYDITKRDNIKAMASIEGFSSEIDGPVQKWDSRMFNSWVSADYKHRFDYLILGASGNFENNVFNYQGENIPDKQNNQKFNAEVNGVSQLTGPFAYKFSVGFARNHYKYSDGIKNSRWQNRMYVKGLISHEIDDRDLSNINLGMDISNYTYGGPATLKNFISADFNPYTDIYFKHAKLHIGANVSLLSDNGSRFAIAPDLGIESAVTKTLTLYANITGGRTAGTFEAMEQVSPYWINILPKPAYTIADIIAGARIAHENLSVDMYAGYAYTKDDFLNYAVDVIEVFEDRFEVINAMGQENTARIYVGANAAYDYEGWLKLSANSRYTHWKCDEKYLLATKPEFELGLNAESRFLDDFYITLAYNFATYGNDAPSKNKNELNLRTSYRFMDRIGAFIEGNNLLNREYVKYAGYYEQGINILLGLSATF